MTTAPSRYKPYPDYKASGVEWLGDIPEGWEAKKLKFVASNAPSNVDKKTKSGEVPVGLCNYTDVYYSEVIEPNPNYMRASATQDQVEKFTLKAGDTIITKDSEDPNDIAIPAYVPNDLDGIVCGYHLSIIRPNDPKLGLYIKRCFESGFARSYFAVHSNGLTRYGLGTYPLNNVILPTPPAKEQTKIAAFLDHETAKIDTLIAKQQRLIALLEEKRQAVISHAVTKGLDKSAPLRPSGIDWLGDVPAHWEVTSLKYLGQITDCKHITADFVDEGFPLASIAEVKGWRVDLSNAKQTTEKYYQSLIEGGRKPRKNDIIYSRNASVGEAAIVTEGMPEFAMGQDVCMIRIAGDALPELILYILKSKIIEQQLELAMIGSTFKRINVEDIRGFCFVLPPIAEQARILSRLDDISTRFAMLIERAQLASVLLKERRTALISAAVTGKIDLRDWQPPEGAQPHLTQDINQAEEALA